MVLRDEGKNGKLQPGTRHEESVFRSVKGPCLGTAGREKTEPSDRSESQGGCLSSCVWNTVLPVPGEAHHFPQVIWGLFSQHM